MNRYLVSVITPNYVLKAAPFLESMHQIDALRVVVQMTPPEPKSRLEGNLWMELRHYLNEQEGEYEWVADCYDYQRPDTHSHNMVQWGRFLDALPFVQPEDLICLTDTDLVVQRDLTATEWEQIEAACTEGNFCASWNCGCSDNLWAEAQRLKLSRKWLADNLNDLYSALVSDGETKLDVLEYSYSQLPCFNCGVLFATAATFRRLQAAYESRCADFYAATSHRSRCQFLMNYCLWVEGIGVAELPASVHVHGHCGSCGLPEGTHWRGEDLWVGEEKVVFRHNLEAPK